MLESFAIDIYSRRSRVSKKRYVSPLFSNHSSSFFQRDQQLTSNNHQPHLILRYEDVSIIDDAAALILFFVQRQVTLGKEDRQHMKKILYQFLPDFLFTAQGELSDDDEGKFHRSNTFPSDRLIFIQPTTMTRMRIIRNVRRNLGLPDTATPIDDEMRNRSPLNLDNYHRNIKTR